jgi:hypothetical protein
MPLPGRAGGLVFGALLERDLAQSRKDAKEE